MLEGRAQESGLSSSVAGELIARYLRPLPRLAEGRALAAVGRARDDRPVRRARLRRPAPGRGRRRAAGARRAGAPLAPGVAEVAHALGRDPAELAATGGDDFELCVCMPPDRAATAEAVAELTWIGEVVEGEPGVEWRDAPPGADAWRGFEH